MTSLRTRAVTGSVVWAVVAIMIGVFGLQTFLDRLTDNRFNELLENRHQQVVLAVANNGANPRTISNGLGDPAYDRPFSGQYWQVQRFSDGLIVTSDSLADELLPAPDPDLAAATIRSFVWTDDTPMRGIEEWITIEDGSRWHVHVASSLEGLAEDRRLLRSNLIAALGVISILGVLGAFLQASVTLRPLARLRNEVNARWDTEGALDPDAYPVEVVPLVTDINTLLERNRDIVSQSRRQAADLAHAIKTPSAIMRNELEKLRVAGQPVAQSIEALDRLDAQLTRSFARMRADGSNAALASFTDLDTSLGRMTRAFAALARNAGKALDVDLEPNLKVRMDQADLEEIMGNLMDNAMKWCDQLVLVSAKTAGDDVVIVVADDGPGIKEEELGEATKGGRRLDTSKPGTGLGLAIAADLAHAYGGSLKLSRSEDLEGLEVAIRLKSSGI